MLDDLELLYRQHLTEADRRLLAQAVGGGVPVAVALGDPRVERSVFIDPPEERGLAQTSPFLTFAVAVHRTAAWLETASYVEERWAPHRTIPLFDVTTLRELLADGAVRFFLVELLASYTHVASGSVWERTRRGWRRRRFSELDPVRLAGLLEVVNAAERAGVYRRLGDLALFLTGVFPERPAAEELGGASAGRLRRLAGLPGSAADGPAGGELLELLGSRWYRLAAASVRSHGSPSTPALSVIERVGERFSETRRVLNTVTDRYLYPVRDRWFGSGS